MYLQNGDMGGMIIYEDNQGEKTQVKEIETDVEEQHNKLKRLREKRKCSDFSKMSYWQVVSHCTIL